MGAPVVHFEITAKDAKPLNTFYAELFDWHVDDNNPQNYGVIDTHGPEAKPGINGGIASNEHMSGTTIYVEVEDMQKTLDKAEELGGKTVVPVTEVPGVVNFAIFTDPAGNPVGVVDAMQEQPQS